MEGCVEIDWESIVPNEGTEDTTISWPILLIK